MSFHKPYIICASLKCLKRVGMTAHPLQFTKANYPLGQSDGGSLNLTPTTKRKTGAQVAHPFYVSYQ